jgi:hypothetical protein
MLDRDQIPDQPRLSASCAQTYRLTLRPKPGSDVIRNLRAALKALRRRYGLQVIELRPVEPKPRATRATHKERQARHKATAHYSFFGKDIPRPPPEGWP